MDSPVFELCDILNCQPIHILSDPMLIQDIRDAGDGFYDEYIDRFKKTIVCIDNEEDNEWVCNVNSEIFSDWGLLRFVPKGRSLDAYGTSKCYFGNNDIWILLNSYGEEDQYNVKTHIYTACFLKEDQSRIDVGDIQVGDTKLVVRNFLSIPVPKELQTIPNLGIGKRAFYYYRNTPSISLRVATIVEKYNHRGAERWTSGPRVMIRK